MTQPKRHHYIPNFYLKNFAHSKSKYLYVYSKKTNKIFSTLPQNICCESNFFKLDNLPENTIKA